MPRTPDHRKPSKPLEDAPPARQEASVLLRPPPPGLLDELKLALKDGASRQAVIDRLFTALSAAGLPCGDGRSVHFRKHEEMRRLQAQLKGFDADGLAALTDFVRQACQLLFSTGRSEAIESLLQLSLWLEDPLVRTDAGFQSAARRAMVRYGLAGLWIKTQRYAPQAMAATLYPTLFQCMQEMQSPAAALRFIEDLVVFLGRHLMLTDPPATPSLGDPRIKDRNTLLRRLVSAFGARMPSAPRPPTTEWKRLAQWVWVTGALLNLLADERTERLAGHATLAPFAGCLRLFHGKGPPFDGTLNLLCDGTLLSDTAYPSQSGLRDLFLHCPGGLRSAVLHLPLDCLWPLPLRAIRVTDLMQANDPASAPQVEVLLGLLEDYLLLPDALALVLSGQLGAARFDELVQRLQDRWEMGPVARDTLDILMERIETVDGWRAGLPSLLRWLQRASTVIWPDEPRRALVFMAGLFTAIRHRAGASDADLRRLGALLVLDPLPKAAKAQLAAFLGAFDDPMIPTLLLLGWVKAQIEGMRQRPGAATPPALKAVLARLKHLLEQPALATHPHLKDERGYFRHCI